MNKLFTKIVGAALGLTMAIGVGVAVASNSKEATPVHAAATTRLTLNTASTTIASGNSYTNYGETSTDYQWAVTCGSKQSAGLWLGSNKNQKAKMILSTGSYSDASSIATAIGVTTSATYYAAIIQRASSIAKVDTVELTYTTPGGTAPSEAWVLYNDGSNGWQVFEKVTSLSASGTTFSHAQVASARYAFVIHSTGYCQFKVPVLTFKGTDSDIAVTGVSVSPTAASLGVGGTQQLTPTITPSDATNKNVTYSSNATGVATVSSTGLITAVAAGNATITVTTADGGYTATCAVTVTAPVSVTGVTLNKNSTSIEVGGTETLTATVAPSDATNKNVTWTTSSSSIATVSNGTVTAVSAGTATITVTTVDGSYTATCSVKVTAPSSVTFVGGTDTGSATGQTDSGTLTKSGVSFYCSGWKNDSGNYRLYSGKTVTFTSTIGNMAKIEFTGTESSYKISNMGSATTGTLVTDETNNKATWTGSASTVSFTMTAQGRASQVEVTLESTDPSVELDATSATSVSMLKGDSDTSVKVLVKNIDSLTWNFTFDEDEDEGLTTSSYISVSASALVSNVSTLTITTKAVGSTTMHISVSGTACEDTVPVTVAAKPQAGTMVAKLNSVVVSSAVEVQTGLYKQFTFAAEDTDGNAYSITADDVTGAKQSGTADVTISGTRVTGTSAGSAVVRYSLKVLSSVYVDITLNVVDDYKTTVKTITVINNAVVDQGDTLEVSDHISVKKANTYWGSEMDIADNELLFSYTNSRAAGVVASSFVFDVTDDTLDAGDTETRTIYVFATFDESYAGTSFTAVITVEDRPVTGLYVNGSEATDEQEFNINVTRYQTYQLDVSVKPSNATESHQIDYAVFMADEGSGVTVNSSGLISVSGVLGQHATISAASHANSDHVVYFNVTVVRETVTITYDQPEVWTVVSNNSTLQAGDQVILTGVKSDVTYAAGLYAGGNNVPADTENTLTVSGDNVTGVVSSMVYTLETGSVSGSLAFKDSQNRYLAAASSGSNYLKTSDTINGESSFILNSDGTVVAQGTYTRNYMRYNNTSTSNLFACYASTGTTGDLVTFYKKSGGEATVTATSGLLDVLDAAMTYDDGTYTLNLCDASGSTFNSSAWTSLGNNFTSSIKSSNQLAYARSSETGNEVEQFLACYDYVVGKYGESYDFLGRIASGKIAASSRIAPLSIINGNGNAVAIIVIISMISVTAIGGYFFIRKRKEQ